MIAYHNYRDLLLLKKRDKLQPHRSRVKVDANVVYGKLVRLTHLLPAARRKGAPASPWR